MTVSTDAIIFYGYAWDEETDAPWTIGADSDSNEDEDLEADSDADDQGWEERYAIRMGAKPPELPYPEKGYDYQGTYTPEEQAAIDAHKAFWDERRRLVDACPCKVDSHCSNDYKMPFVCIKDSYICNSRGDMTELTQDQFEIEPHWNDELKKFCKLMGITPPAGGPKWYLVSWWG